MTPSQQQIGPTNAPFQHAKAYRGTILVLAGGILLQALNIYVTSSLMPSAIVEIGGESFYSWVLTVYIVASIVACMLVSQLLLKFGAARSYAISAAIFAVGSLICALAPNMEFLLAGRAFQGVGGGLLSGLAYATISSALPQEMWAKGTAIISAMFAVGTLAGPALGGLFAQFGAWRMAFVSITFIAVILGALAFKFLPNSETGGQSSKIPYLPLATLALAVGALSIAGVVSRSEVWIWLSVAAVLVATFIALDRLGKVSVLPKLTYQSASRLKWIYLAMGLSAAAVSTEAFTPLFGQRMIGLEPVVAGFLGATISAGWSFAGVLSSRISSEVRRRQVMVAGPAVVAVSLVATALLQSLHPSGWSVLAWAVTLLIAGVGIGLSNPHFAVAIMGSTADEVQSLKAAGAIPIVSQIGQVLAVAVGGLLVNIGLPSMQRAASNLSYGIAVFALIGLVAAVIAFRRVPLATSPSK